MLVNEINGISKMRGVRCSSSTLAMEHCLHERDRVGLQDFVLLEDFQNEAAFLDNLRKRFQENIIYVSIILSNIVKSFHLIIVSIHLRHISGRC